MSLFLKALLLLAQNFLAYRRLKKAESSTGLPPESEGPAGSPPLPQSSKLEGILPTGTVSDTQTASLPRSKAMPMVFQTNRNSETLPPAESANRCNSDKESDSRWEIYKRKKRAKKVTSDPNSTEMYLHEIHRKLVLIGVNFLGLP